MTDEELSELRRCAERCVTHYEGCDCRQLAHVEEVERLRAENAALREIAQAVATGDATYRDKWKTNRCCFCGQDDETSETIEHDPDCTVTRARSLLEANS